MAHFDKVFRQSFRQRLCDTAFGTASASVVSRKEMGGPTSLQDGGPGQVHPRIAENSADKEMQRRARTRFTVRPDMKRVLAIAVLVAPGKTPVDVGLPNAKGDATQTNHRRDQTAVREVQVHV
jgi:hypothetical protein